MKENIRNRRFTVRGILYVMLLLIWAMHTTADAAGSSAVVKNAKLNSKVTVGNYVYQITKLSKKKSTVAVTGLTNKGRKKVKKAVIPATVKIRSKKGKNKGTYSYQVTAVKENAFRGNSKLTSVSIGKNVRVIGKRAFENCVKLKKVSVESGSKLQEIQDFAFSGCRKLKDFDMSRLPNLKTVADTAFDRTDIKEVPEEETTDITSYSYEVYPLLAPFNDMFFIKTDNPDPDSFRLYDKSSAYDEPVSTSYNPDGSIKEEVHNCSIQVKKLIYPDVVYEDKETFRVKGGYLGYSAFTNVDGGELTLQKAGKGADLEDSWSDTGYEDTKVKITMSKVYDTADYLIETFGKSSSDFFERMDAINSGFDKICLYSGASVRGELVKDTSFPYYGISNSPHVDQDFYIQSPYGRKDGKRLLISDLHPMRYDSLGFPRVMGEVAYRLNPNVSIKWNDNMHWLIDVTLNGVTKSYGGAGNGGGKAITEDKIKYFFRFDGSSGDAFKGLTYDKASDILKEYGKLEIPDDIPADEKLTWAKVQQTVGTEGSYVKIIGIYSIYGSTGDAYTFLYDNGSQSEGDSGWSGMGYFSNAWYDGRYYNRHETIEKGTKFGDKSQTDGIDTSQASIVVKDPCIPIPQDGKEYLYRYSPISEASQYDPETGIWKGLMVFRYNSSTDTWIADVKNSIQYRGDDRQYYNCEDTDFINAATLTKEEVADMGIDRNADLDPAEYYDYTKKVAPGTKGKN